jgi:hypothetical protein
MNNHTKFGSVYDDGSYLATNTEQFTDFNQHDITIIPLSQFDDTAPEIAVNYDVDGEDETLYPQYVTYIDHPVIKNKFNQEYEMQSTQDEESSPIDVNIHFDQIVHFYFGSLAVLGLFILFRGIQKSKY